MIEHVAGAGPGVRGQRESRGIDAALTHLTPTAEVPQGTMPHKKLLCSWYGQGVLPSGIHHLNRSNEQVMKAVM